MDAECWARRCHLQLSRPLQHQRPSPRCATSQPPASSLTPRRGHILRRPPDSPPSRRPWRATPGTRVGDKQLERLERRPPDWPPQNPGPAQWGLRHSLRAGRLPGERPRGRWPGPAPSGASPSRRLTSSVSKAHVRRRSADVSAPPA